jgi:general secretion pathway protein G
MTHVLEKEGKAMQRRDDEAGFTLVEILVVITIIGLVMVIVGPRVLNYLGESKVKAAKIQIESLGSALNLYYRHGRYPNSNDGLSALVQRPGNTEEWNGPYIEGEVVPNDPWGHAYVYRPPVEHAPYEIVSYGSDGQEGGSGCAALSARPAGHGHLLFPQGPLCQSFAADAQSRRWDDASVPRCGGISEVGA